MSSVDAVITPMRAAGVIAVVVIDRLADAVPLAEALAAGGVDVIEVTFRTDCAGAAIEAIRDACPTLHVGAGTVLDEESLRRAVDAGATFGLSPGFNSDVSRLAVEFDLPFFPGVATPTEIQAATSAGHRILKFFPAATLGGAKALASSSAPFVHLGVQFIPTGGVTASNVDEYWSLPAVIAVGGTWLAPREAVQNGDFRRIETLAGEVVAARRANS